MRKLNTVHQDPAELAPAATAKEELDAIRSSFDARDLVTTTLHGVHHYSFHTSHKPMDQAALSFGLKQLGHSILAGYTSLPQGRSYVVNIFTTINHE